jgi:hypothetical protein
MALHAGNRDPTPHAGAVVLEVLGQALLAQRANEVVDWRSGTDRHATPRALSGGSKVVALGLIGQRGLLVLQC